MYILSNTQMSEAVGFNITPDSGTSLRKVLKHNLESHLDSLEAVSVAASKVRHDHYTHVHVHVQCTCRVV